MACENNTVNNIVRFLDAKKAIDIAVLNVSGLTTLADYFIIATGKTDKQTQALCDNVEEEMKKQFQISPVNKEGYRSGDWILLGFDEAIVHIFQPQARDFYDLEHVWQDALRVDVTDIITED